MVSDLGLVVVSIISLIGMIIIFMLNTSTWFKKENFKIKKKALMDENRINIKSLEKRLGLQGATKAYQEPQTTLETGANLLDVVKNLSGEQIQGLADKFLTPQDEQEGQPQSTMDSLLQFATDNPEIAANFLKGVTGDKKGESDIYES